MQSDFSGGPGFLAFLATFGLVVAGVLLFLSLSRHLRKVRSQEPRERAAEQAEQAGLPEQAEQADASSPEASGDAEGGERGGDEVADEAGDR